MSRYANEYSDEYFSDVLRLITVSPSHEEIESVKEIDHEARDEEISRARRVIGGLIRKLEQVVPDTYWQTDEKLKRAKDYMEETKPGAK